MKYERFFVDTHTCRIRVNLMQTCPRVALSAICPDADLPACCSFRHGLRRTTFLREEGFGFYAQSNLSLWESRESGANFLLLRTIQLVSPSGRDVAQRQRGLAPSLRELDLPQAKTEGAANYLSRIRANDREGLDDVSILFVRYCP